MLLRVDIAEVAYLVDVGFGGRLAATPQRLDFEGGSMADVSRVAAYPAYTPPTTRVDMSPDTAAGA